MMHDKSSIEIKPGSVKSFGYVFAAVFALVGLYPALFGGEPRLWSLGLCVIFLLITWLRPSVFEKPNYAWFRFGLFLGGIVAPIVMGLVYIITIVPTGAIMRLLGKDLIKRKLDKQAKSYWIKREVPPQPMKNQF